MSKRLKNNVYFQLFFGFFKIGLFTIGGGMAMVPLIQREVVERKGWMNNEEMVDCIAVCQSLPGVVAINTATYVGNYKKGIKGSLAASVGVILPSIIIIILIALALSATAENPYINGALIGIKGAAVGLIGYAAFSIGKNILKDPFSWIVALISLGLLIFLDISALWVILGGILVGLIYTAFKAKGRGDSK